MFTSKGRITNASNAWQCDSLERSRKGGFPYTGKESFSLLIIYIFMSYLKYLSLTGNHTGIAQYFLLKVWIFYVSIPFEIDFAL